MNDGEAEKSIGDRTGFDVVFSGEGIYEAVEVGYVVVFYAVVIDDEGKVDGIDSVGEEARLELVVAVG